MPQKIKSAILAAFGKRVRKLREKRGMSQEELAFQSGLHRTYIGFVERAERSITLENILKLARGLKVSLSTLFRGLKT